MIQENISGRLGFSDAVLDAFAFLQKFGFVVARRESTLVSFESSTIFINVYHGRSSYQVGVELGKIHQQDVYTLFELFSVFAPSNVDMAKNQASEPVALRQCVASIAQTIEQNCGSALLGEESSFMRLRSVSCSMRTAITLQAQFGAILDQADRAWEEKNWSLARRLYQESESALDETRRRRFEFLQSKE